MDNKIQSNIRVVNLANYVQPTVEEVPSKEYVTYGDKNSYFYYLIDRARGSATNGSVINSIVQQIYGKGLNSDALNEMIDVEDQKRLANDLKRMGQCAMQVQYFGNRASAKATHIPVETLAPEKANEDGEIEAYYYSKDWSKVKNVKDLERIPAFGTSDEGLEIIYIKPYNAGLFYFSVPDYHGGLQYANLEEEISNYHINNVQNGLAPSMLINVNGGVPETEEKARKIEEKFIEKYSGSSNAGRMVLMFNDNAENASSITPIPLSDASEQYQFLSEEAARKILISHRIVSPLLMGINTATGFSSNADELKVASVLTESMVIEPFRMLLIDQGFSPLMEFNGKSEDLEFESLNPFDKLVEEEIEEEVEEIEETELSSHDFDHEIATELIGLGEDEDLENWELIDEREVLYDYEDELDTQIHELNNPKESLLSKIRNFVSTGTAIPNAKSEQDGENSQGVKFKVRYQYAPLKVSENSRAFCKSMVSASKVYRKEDIIRMDNQPVNAGWGLNGADTYSIWLYKGGGACHHKWFRKTYVQRSKTKIDINSPLAPTISTTKARQEGFRPEANDSKVSVAPVNMPNQGFVNK